MDISELHFQTNASISDMRRHFAMKKFRQLHCAEIAITRTRHCVVHMSSIVYAHLAITSVAHHSTRHRHVEDRRKLNKHKGFARMHPPQHDVSTTNDALLNHSVTDPHHDFMAT